MVPKTRGPVLPGSVQGIELGSVPLPQALALRDSPSPPPLQERRRVSLLNLRFQLTGISLQKTNSTRKFPFGSVAHTEGADTGGGGCTAHSMARDAASGSSGTSPAAMARSHPACTAPVL